jgi:hypothetical protein
VAAERVRSRSDLNPIHAPVIHPLHPYL